MFCIVTELLNSLHSPICLHGVVLELSKGTSLPLPSLQIMYIYTYYDTIIIIINHQFPLPVKVKVKSLRLTKPHTTNTCPLPN